MNKVRKKTLLNIRKIFSPINNLIRESHFLHRHIVLAMDLFLAMASFFVSYLFSAHLRRLDTQWDVFLVLLSIYVVIMFSFFWLFKTYRGIIRYTSFRDIFNVFCAICCAHILMAIINEMVTFFTGTIYFPGLGLVLNCGLIYSLIITKKATIMLVYDFVSKDGSKNRKRMPMLVYGVSSTLVEMSRMITVNPESPYKLLGFIAPDSNASDKKIQNLPVFDGSDLKQLFEEQDVEAVLINPTELERNIKQEIADICIQNKIELLSLPPMQDWKDSIKKKMQVNKIRIEDLLGRVPIQIDVESIGESLNGKTIMVTGAAGSIGSEIIRQISKFRPGLLLLCDAAETPMHELRLELEEKHPELNFQPFVIDVRNECSMEHLFKNYRPEFVYHAAAYKHVPLMEECPNEAVLANIMGTKIMVDLAVKYKVKSFVMISTDKAVNPTNVMGCSKRIAEIYVQSMAVQPEIAAHTRFITTRFGNVLGSNGSVIPRFREQIEKGGPVTVTHKNIIRYFMTIPEACRLVLEAGNMGKGGEIFVFDMGDPVKIADLAAKMIRLAGYEPNVDIPIQYTGLRPGEKLYEELLNDEEQTKPTHNRKIKIGRVREYDNYPEIHEKIQQLINAARSYESMKAVMLMKEIVPEFISKNSKFEILDNRFDKVPIYNNHSNV